jgi:hypothetical protein
MYKLTSGTSIIRTDDGAVIPADGANTDYQTYQAWLAAGNTPLPADVQTFAQKQSALVVRIKQEASGIIEDTILSLGTEYQKAKTDADAYKAAGYTGIVPPSVQSWADAKIPPQTTTWAANDIITQGASWLSAQDSIRANRLKYSEQAKAATAQAGLDTALASWTAFKNSIRSQLGI